MRAVVQRVTQARVEVAQQVVGEIGAGLLVLLSVEACDTAADVTWMAEKLSRLRIFPDTEGKMNLSLLEAGGSLLLVSQFTLHGDCRKGNRPSFIAAAPPEVAEERYLQVAQALRSLEVHVALGKFRADMQVHLINDGPVTLLLDSKKVF